jgi:hypothetical protein
MRIAFFLGLSLIFLIVFEQAKAQDVPKKEFAIGAGLSLLKMEDNAMSPIQYRSLIPNLFLGYENSIAKRQHLVEWRGELGTLKPRGSRHGKISEAQHSGTELRYAHLRLLKSNSSTSTWHIGPGAGILFRYRLHNQLGNSSEIYENINSLGFAIAHSRSVFNDKYTLRAQAFVPLIALAIRPSFTNIGHAISPDRSIYSERFREHGLVGPGNYQALSLNWQVNKALSNNRNASLAYRWDYTDYRKLNRLQSAQHHIIIQYRFTVGRGVKL